MAETEIKQLDEVLKPAPKEPETFTETPMSPQDRELKEYFESLNKQYLLEIKKLGLANEWDLTVDGKKTWFVRNELSVRQVKDLERLQLEFSKKPKNQNSLWDAQQVADLYLEYAQMFLINKETGQKISKIEYEQQKWERIRKIIDGNILREMMGVSGMGG